MKPVGPDTVEYQHRLNATAWEAYTEMGMCEGQTALCSLLFIAKDRAIVTSLTSDPEFSTSEAEVERRGWFAWPPPRNCWEVSFDRELAKVSLEELNRLAATMVQVAARTGARFMGTGIFEWRDA